jgi:choline dehydrogenase-like flavoprotein
MSDFDYIVIGAGCVLAQRLTEDQRYRVLLLEAGGSERRFRLQVPICYGKSFYDPQVIWTMGCCGSGFGMASQRGMRLGLQVLKRGEGATALDLTYTTQVSRNPGCRQDG